jgi:hypothetical protein
MLGIDTMILHPQDRLEGGLSDVERRALIELGLITGARKVLLYDQSVELSDEQILNLTFQDANSMLNID